ncbi:alpha/beta fold hydrolase [Kribbella sp. NPDC026611]|uniref:alpha/beta fold hydrolase n=1 Tax=Kribbella sp. NPDC026611 TaxID=3154911 RepID=UPI0033C32DB5
MSLTWIVVPGLAETPEEFGRVVELLPDADVRVLDPWRTPLASDVDALRAAAGLAPDAEVGLIGHSIGGLVVLRWALTRPLEVRKLVLVDTSLTSETGWSVFYPGTRADRILRSITTSLGRIGLPRLTAGALRWLVTRIGSISHHDSLSKATIRERYGAPTAWLLFWTELAGSWVIASEVAKLTAGPVGTIAPTTMLVATGGTSRPTARSWLAGSRRLAEVLGATVEVLPDAAHLVHLDRPDAIAAAALS